MADDQRSIRQSVERSSLVGELARFVVVGGVAVGIDALLYVTLHQVFGWQPSWAKRLSFAAGTVWAFFANKLFTFGTQSWTTTEPMLFVLVYAFGWLANSLTHDLILSATSMGWLSFLSATAVSTATNFIGSKWVVFRRPDVEETS